MEKKILILGLTLCLSTIANSQYYSKTLPFSPKQEVVTNLHFFFHDTLSGKNPSAVMVAKANLTDRGDGDNSPTPFGTLFAIDDPLTIGSDPNSKLIGNARGMYVSSGKNVPSLTVYFDFGFTAGEFNGSSISILSRNPITEKERELAVVGGRGRFKMARGFAHLKTYFVNMTNGDAIVEYNVTLIHY